MGSQLLLNLPIKIFADGADREGIAALNAGNYQAVRRMVADTLFRPLWRNACGSLEHIIETPPGKELWYFEADTPFLQQDQKDGKATHAIECGQVTAEAGLGRGPLPRGTGRRHDGFS